MAVGVKPWSDINTLTLALPRLSIDHFPVLQQGLPDTLFPRIAVITMSRIIHDLFRSSPIGRSERLIPRSEDIIVRDEWAGVLQRGQDEEIQLIK